MDIVNIIVTVLTAALGSWLVLGMTFLAYPTVMRLKEVKDELGWITLIPVYLVVAIGGTADVVFNATCGIWVFKELPREFMYTDRLKRHWYGKDEKQKRRAEPWVIRVNRVHPGHV